MLDRTSRSFADLHCHSTASFNSLSSPGTLVKTARRFGLTHLAITDHERIDGALRARDLAAIETDGVPLTIIVGEEVRTADGDMLGLFLEHTVPPGPFGHGDCRRDSRPGWPRGTAAPVRSLPRFERQDGRRRVARRARSRGRLHRGAQRSCGRWRERAGRRACGCARLAASRFVRRAFADGGRRRLHRAQRAVLDRRRAARAPADRGYRHRASVVLRAVADAARQGRQRAARESPDSARARSPRGAIPRERQRQRRSERGRRRDHPGSRRGRPTGDNDEVVDYPLVQEGGGAPPPSLSSRLRDPRTIISIVLPILILVLIFAAAPGFELDQLPGLIAQANPWYLLAAVGIYYLGFPLRGYRWALLVRGAGDDLGVKDSTEIIFISWLVNCVVPAKLGDVYRAYLLRRTSRSRSARSSARSSSSASSTCSRSCCSGSRPASGASATACRARSRSSSRIGLVVDHRARRRPLLRAQLRPQGDHAAAAAAPRHGVLRPVRGGRLLDLAARDSAPGVRHGADLGDRGDAPLPGHPGARLSPTSRSGISGAFFVALIASLLTAVPFTPAGLGIVEAGHRRRADAVLQRARRRRPRRSPLLDRTISVLSVIVFGAIAWVLSSKTKARVGRGDGNADGRCGRTRRGEVGRVSRSRAG